MYWREMYSSPQAAQRALALDARGSKKLTPIQRAVAQTAVRSGLGDVGSISSFFKKVVKIANKADPLYSLRKKIDPVTKAVDRAVGITKSSPKIAPTATADVPGSTMTPASATVPVSTLQPDFSFAPGGGGGTPAINPPAADAATDTSVPTWMWVAGAGAAALLLYFMFKKK